MQPVRWGILGAAKFAREHMAPAIHAAAGAELVAIATSDPEKAKPFSAFCPDIGVLGGYDTLLSDPDIDAVYIPLPNSMHVEWASKAMRAGKHVLCEKPLAMRADQIDALIALRDETGLFAAEAYMIVHHPQWQLVRRWLDEGRIGRLRHADVVFTFDNPDPANIRNRPETGGGSIPDIGVYAYSSVRFAARAEPAGLQARIRRENGVDTYAHVTGEMESAGGRFTYSSITSTRLFPRQEVTFQGETGRISLTAPFNAGLFGEAQVHLHRAGGASETVRFPGARQYVIQVENACHSIREGAPYPWTLEDARGTQAMIDKVLAAETPI